MAEKLEPLCDFRSLLPSEQQVLKTDTRPSTELSFKTLARKDG